MQTTKHLLKPQRKHKKFHKQVTPILQAVKSKSTVSSRSVASTPVRRQLPRKLTVVHHRSVKRMQAFVSWATNQTSLLAGCLAVKRNRYSCYSTGAIKRVGGNRRPVFARKKSAVSVKRRSGLSFSSRVASAVIKPYTNSLWSFLTWYKRTSCQKETLRWRLKQKKLLSRWVLSPAFRSPVRVIRRRSKSKFIQKPQFGLFAKRGWKKSEPASRKYAAVRALYRAKYQIEHGVCPTEAKVRFLQKQCKRWYLRRHRKVFTPRWLSVEYARISKPLATFIAQFNRLKGYRKNARRLRARFKQVVATILPQRCSIKMLASWSAVARYRYVLSWTFSALLWRFISPNFVVSPFKQPHTTSSVKARVVKKISLGNKLEVSKKQPMPLQLQTTWLTFGNKQVALVSRDMSIKYKKVWAKWANKALKPLRSWKRHNKQLFWIGWKERKKKNKACMRLTNKLAWKAQYSLKLKKRAILTPEFISVFNRRFTTQTPDFTPKDEKKKFIAWQPKKAILLTEEDSTVPLLGEKNPALWKTVDQPIKKKHTTKREQQTRGRLRTKRRFKTKLCRKLLFQFFYNRQVKLLGLRFKKLLRRLQRRTVSTTKLKLLQALRQFLVRRKLPSYRRHEHRMRRYLTVGKIRYLARRHGRSARKGLPNKLSVKPATKEREVLVYRKRTQTAGLRLRRPLSRMLLHGFFTRWLRPQRNMTRGHKLWKNRKAPLKSVVPRPPASPFRIRKNINVNASLKKLIALNLRSKFVTKSEVQRLQRGINRVRSRRVTKRGVKHVMTRKTLLPVIWSSKDLLTTFDTGALRTIPGKKWQKKLRKVRVIQAWRKSFNTTNTHLAYLSPYANLSMAARKAGQLHLPKTSLHAAHKPLILSTGYNIDTFPFNSRATEARKQELIDRKRAETLALRSLLPQTSLTRAPSSVVIKGVQRNNLYAREASAALHSSQRVGFVRDLNRLFGREKAIVATALKRSVLTDNQKIIAQGLKLKRCARSSWQTVLGGVWATSVVRRRKQIALLKQQFPRKGSRRRRYARGVKKQLRFLLLPPKPWHRKRRGKKQSRKNTLRKSFNKLRALARRSNLLVNYRRQRTNRSLSTGNSQPATFSKIVVASFTQKLKSKATWAQLKRRESRDLLSKRAFVTPQYRLRFRLFTKAGRASASQEELSKQKKINRLRLQRARYIYAQRRAAATAWTRKNRPFKRSALFGYEEKFKRNMHKTKLTNSRIAKTENNIGYPALLGQRRVRRVFIPRFNKNRWWKPAPIHVPHLAQTALSRQDDLVGFDTTAVIRAAKVLYLPGSTPNQGQTLSVKHFLKENRSWRLFGRGLEQEIEKKKLLKPAAVVSAALLALDKQSTYFTRAWALYAERTSVKAAAQLRASFIDSSVYWLQERPVEKLVSKWTLRDWTNFKRFVLHSDTLSSTGRSRTEEFKVQFIFTSRQELFITSPDWWQEETRRRACLLFKAMALAVSPSAALYTVASANSKQALFVAQASLGWQEKKLLIFSALTVLREEQKTVFNTNLMTSTRTSDLLGDKPFSTFYSSWLSGIETHLKKLKSNRSSYSYNVLRRNAVTTLGTESPRFPGSGRRKFTFDSLLRSHYTKTSPMRFRRSAGLRFHKIRPLTFTTFTAHMPTQEATLLLRRGGYQTQRAKASLYPTRRRRELLCRVGGSKNRSVATPVLKSRFAALPAKLIAALQAKTARQTRVTPLTANTGVGEALLQHALRRRFIARSVRDLRKSGRRRRLPRIYSKPFWIQNRMARKKNRADRCDLYKLPPAGGYTPAVSSQWACSDFSLQVAKTAARPVSKQTVGGELLLSPVSLHRHRYSVTTPGIRFANVADHWNQQALVGFSNTKQNKLRLGKFRWSNLGRIRGRVRRLRKNAKRENKYYPQQWKLAIRTAQKTLQDFTATQHRFHNKFIQRTQSGILLTPLHFRKHTVQVSVSAAEKERWRLHIQATRQRKYRRLIEQSDALTVLFPQLISRILENKLRGVLPTTQEAAQLVSSTYWNLRVYLQHDFGRRKFVSRDDNVKRILGATKEITTAALLRHFSLLELTQARHRFQPYKLHPGASLARGAAEWQRRFLPRFYELNLEDPQKYGHLTITPLKIFRTNLNRKKISEWETRKVPGLMENRFTRLTTERHGKNSRCFENMLMTTRRLPIIGGYGAAATLQVINPVGRSAARKSFFSRGLTTRSNYNSQALNNKKLGLVTSRMSEIRRHTVTESKPITQALGSAAHRLLKQSSVSRLRAQHTYSANDTGTGSIDLRLLRAKSPRNAEYVQREKSGAVAHSSKVIKIYGRASVAVFRSSRESFSKMPHLVNEITQKRCLVPNLKSTRVMVHLRRRPALLQTRGRVEKRQVKNAEWPRLYSTPRLANRRNRCTDLTVFNENSPSKTHLTSAVSKQHPTKPAVAISANRAILQFRKGAHRSVYQYQTHVPGILNRSIKLNHTAWNLLKRYHFGKQLRNKTYLQKKNQTLRGRLSHLTGGGSTRPNRNPARLKSVCLPRNVVTLGKTLGFLKRARNTGRFYRPFYWSNARKLTRLKKLTSANVTSYFKTFATAIHRNKRVFSNYANRLEQTRAQTLFMRRRPQLWRDLTIRWMKKFRLLKNWLKTVKYSFKQKVWGVDGQPALPDVLFKMARLRLRKLEWREASDRFERFGLRQAFTFHPKERRHARWLEALMYRRSLYSYQRGEYRRDQFPREQKSRKWMQRLRKLMYRRKLTHLYLKRRRWPTLRRYNQKLHRSAFNICTSKAMLKRFRKLARRKPVTTGFEKLMSGFGDRLDVNLMLLNIAPTTFWAREIAPMGLFKVNGKVVREASFRFTPGDHIEFSWEKLRKLRTHFASSFKRYDKTIPLQGSSLMFPGNFVYNAALRTAQYMRRPRPDDLQESSRINPRLFRWSRLDSGLGR
jgi:ribosomal protein S4